MTNTRIRTALRRGITYRPTKPAEPTRPVTDCATCNDGCDCEGGIEGIGCEHWSCWGRAATNACPSAEPLRQHMHAMTQYRNDLYAYDQQSHIR